MATGNFCYENRCVVVSGLDFKINNVPKRLECVNNDYSFPSWLIEEFEYWEVVITSGYYEGACIDYKEHHSRSAYDVVQGYIGYPCSKKELFKSCKEEFGLSRYRMNKICGNVNGMDIDTYVEKSTEKVGEYLAEKERKKVETFIDGLKQLHGYEEYCCVGRASNGEAFYQKVG